jgi:hypothetical protein
MTENQRVIAIKVIVGMSLRSGVNLKRVEMVFMNDPMLRDAAVVGVY